MDRDRPRVGKEMPQSDWVPRRTGEVWNVVPNRIVSIPVTAASIPVTIASVPDTMVPNRIAQANPYFLFP